MARKSHEDALGVAGAETVIGTGVIVVGNLASDSDIAIDGNLDGNIKAGGNVTIGLNANVKGDVEGTNVIVAGNLTGNIKASGEASILETGHVKGNIHASGLAVTSGGIFNGRSLMEVSSPLAPDNDSDSIKDVRGS
jgi:cytoskeletal protein CcmA (bactofilin family)